MHKEFRGVRGPWKGVPGRGGGLRGRFLLKFFMFMHFLGA